MNISSIANFNLSNQFSNRHNHVDSQVSFESRSAEKLIDKIKKSPYLYSKSLKLTFDDAVKIYKHLGYDILMKRGSHAIIPTSCGNFPLVIPHKDKYLNPKDVARLKLLIDGDVKKALSLK